MKDDGMLLGVKHSTNPDEGFDCRWNDEWRCFFQEPTPPICMTCINCKLGSAFVKFWNFNPLLPVFFTEPINEQKEMHYQAWMIFKKMIWQEYPDEAKIIRETAEAIGLIDRHGKATMKDSADSMVM
jgi:hypothetical protein